MNVIRYDIEVKKSPFNFSKRKQSVSQTIRDSFENELEYEGDLNDALVSEWDKIEFKKISSLNSTKYLRGYTTTKNVQIFLFEKGNKSVRSKKAIALEVIAFGSLPVDKIQNESFFKLRSVFSELNACYINESQVFIYPFDSQEQDIYSYELKVKADLRHPFNVQAKDIARWILVLIAVAIFAILYYKQKSDLTNAKKNINDDDLVKLYLSIFESGCFYLMVDLILYFMIPFLTQRKHRRVVINDLSSVVETGKDTPDDGVVDNLQIPA